MNLELITLENDNSIRSQNATLENARGKHRKYLLKNNKNKQKSKRYELS